ncbi:MAG: deoxyribodipyrimidine photolyase [Planctomycetales bacterium]|nr:deoxyribodipyrimidine photolyase [Planctomycetales bacterium]
MAAIPAIRLQSLNGAEVDREGQHVLYWMIANRRTRYNFSLQHAVEYARQLDKPLFVLEALRCDYPWASDRLHRFVVQGMADNRASLADAPAYYYPYVEPATGAGKGLLKSLAEHACAVVTDDFPAFFLPKMLNAASRHVQARFEKVDSNGLLPMRAADRVFTRAFDLRRYLQKNLLPHLSDTPVSHPLSRVKLPQSEIPQDILEKWPPADLEALLEPHGLDKLPIDHQVRPVHYSGGADAAGKTLNAFLKNRLQDYDEQRNQPQQQVTSELSPYLHFGHISVHEVFEKLTKLHDWSPGMTSGKANGSRSGWWGLPDTVESYLDELITWRELGFNLCSRTDDYDKYSSLPDWARQTLEDHKGDQRGYVYTLEEFEHARTHDPLWNAAQNQLVLEGRIHNYLRMLWGKKILEWTNTPQHALRVMIELNNKYAVDGRNPNSYSGICWVLGRYDRPWGPEREIYGKIRYMSSENTARKVKVSEYIARYNGHGTNGQKRLFED